MCGAEEWHGDGELEWLLKNPLCMAQLIEQCCSYRGFYCIDHLGCLHTFTNYSLKGILYLPWGSGLQGICIPSMCLSSFPFTNSSLKFWHVFLGSSFGYKQLLRILQTCKPQAGEENGLSIHYLRLTRTHRRFYMLSHGPFCEILGEPSQAVEL